MAEDKKLTKDEQAAPETEQKAQAKRPAAPKKFTADEVDDIVKKAVAEALKQAQLDQSKQEQVVMQVKKDEFVTLLFLGAIADGTVVALGKLGQINRAGGTIDIPKSTFLQGMDYKVERMLQSRKLIVVNGLTEEERERFGVNYREGELLTQSMFYKLLDFDAKDIAQIYESLCPEHKRLVATMFITAYEKGDIRVNAEKVKALNKLSKTIDKDGLFTPILESMGKKMTEDD